MSFRHLRSSCSLQTRRLALLEEMRKVCLKLLWDYEELEIAYNIQLIESLKSEMEFD